MALTNLAEKLGEFFMMDDAQEHIAEIMTTLKAIKQEAKSLDDPDLKDKIQEYFQEWRDEQTISDDFDRFSEKTEELIMDLGEGGLLS